MSTRDRDVEIVLAGGWGYGNLGDEAILAGYVAHLSGRYSVRVASVDPNVTAAAQPWPVDCVDERRTLDGTGTTLVVGGGGYLNGSWWSEIGAKLRRLNRLASRADAKVVHAVEMRGLDRPDVMRAARRLVAGGQISVRDEPSRLQALELGASAKVVPDAIALLSPHVWGLVAKVRELEGKVLLNLQDLNQRADRHESQVDVLAWRSYCLDVINILGDRAVGLFVDAGDMHFDGRPLDIPMIRVTTVRGLVSAIGSADALLSVRMHPALLATMLDTPVALVPYNGKIRPTASRLGLDSIVLEGLTIDEFFRKISSRVGHQASVWPSAFGASSYWLGRALGESG